MFEHMVAEGVAPNTVTCNSLITACKEGALLWHKLLALLAPVPVQSIAFCQWHAYIACRATSAPGPPVSTPPPAGNQWERAAEIFDTMKLRGCRPDIVTFTMLIGAYEKAGQWRPALKVGA